MYASKIFVVYINYLGEHRDRPQNKIWLPLSKSLIIYYDYTSNLIQFVLFVVLTMLLNNVRIMKCNMKSQLQNKTCI